MTNKSYVVYWSFYDDDLNLHSDYREFHDMERACETYYNMWISRDYVDVSIGTIFSQDRRKSVLRDRIKKYRKEP